MVQGKKKISTPPSPIDSLGAEHRYLPRWELNNKIVYYVGKDLSPKTARTKDLNLGGTCFLSKHHYQVDQKIKLKIIFQDKKAAIIQGHIVWCRPDKKGYLIGVTFDKLSDKSQKALLDHAFELQVEDLVKMMSREKID